jgi:WD40 repeat protein
VLATFFLGELMFAIAAFSPDESILAIAYEGRPVKLWDLADDGLIGPLGRETQLDLSSLPLGSNTSASSLVFHPDESVTLLAVAYEDGDLGLFDYDELKLIKLVKVNAHIVACSPDGTTLATGNSTGMVQLLAFETLQLLFRADAVDYPIRALAFSADNLRLIDARGTQCNVWEPSLPSGRSQRDDASSNWVPPEPRIVGLSDDRVRITAMATEESSRWFFVGKSDGSVWLYRTSDGRPERLLYRHGYDEFVEYMEWGNKESVLVTAGSLGCLKVFHIARDDATGGFADPIQRIGIRGDIQSTASINQLLLNKANDLLLVSTDESDAVWDLDRRVRIHTAEVDHWRWSHCWVNNPLDETERLLVGIAGAEVWDWKSGKLKIAEEHLRWLSNNLGAHRVDVKCVSEAPHGRIFVQFECRDQYWGNSAVAVHLLHSGHLQPGRTEPLVPSDAFASLTQDLAHFIGICGSKLFFLDKRFGICSIDFLDGKRPGFRHVNHCFIPNDWRNRRGPPIIQVTGKGDILFGRTQDVAVVKHTVAFEDERREAFE